MKTNHSGIALAWLVTTLLLTACGGGGGGSAPPATPPVTPPATPAATLQSIAVTPQNPTISLYSSTQLAATGTYSDNTTSDITTSVTWSSGSIAAVKVTSNGLSTSAVGAVAGQTAVITATSGTLTTSTTITLAAVPAFTVTDPLFPQQWGLHNTGQNGYADTAGVANPNGTLGTDINVYSVYTTYGYTGKGVIVAVVDSGLEIAHEDLAANVVPGGSWNFVNNTTDPTSTSTTGDHGTEVSGLIAMAMNGIGGIGVAPNAKLKGFNFLKAGIAANEIVSLGGSTASPNSSDVFIFNQSFGTENTVDYPMNSTVEAQYAYGVSALRGGKGALYVKSAGNGWYGFGSPTAAKCAAAQAIGISCQNVNFDPSNTLPYNIVMAALDADGTVSSYSSAGSAIWASAPGGENGLNVSVAGTAYSVTAYNPAMVTTDQSGCAAGASVTGATTSLFNQGGTNVGSINLNCNYTNGMNGTSSAAPMMSGSIALILEANPSLTWREVKDILAKTSVPVSTTLAPLNVQLGNGSYVTELPWITNAAGYKFHNWFGFGAVNVSAAVDMARTYVSGSLGTFANTGGIVGILPVSATVLDNSITGVSVPLAVPKVGTSGIVEAVQIRVTTSATKSTSTSGCITNTEGCTGDLGIELTSPLGTKSILKNIKDGLNSFYLSGMVLESNAFYGESSNGTWIIKVVDGWAGSGNQTLTDVRIRVYGH